MSEQASAGNRNANDGNPSSVVPANPSSGQPGFSNTTQPRTTCTLNSCRVPVQKRARLSEALAQTSTFNGPPVEQAAASGPGSISTSNDPMATLIWQCGDSRHQNQAEFGYFVHYDRVEPFLRLLRELPEVRPLGFDLADKWLREAAGAWPKALIPAYRIIEPLQDAIRETRFHLEIVNIVRSRMNDHPRLKWWATSEYKVCEMLPDSLAHLTGLDMPALNAPDKEVYTIVDVLLKLSEIDGFSLPEATLATLRHSTSAPSFSDNIITFDTKLDALRRQVKRVWIKYQEFVRLLKPLEDQVEKLEAEVRRHETSISKA